MDPIQYFSATMPEADAKFVAACEKHGVPVQSFRHPLRGPDGEALQTLACRLGPPNAPHALMVISATHGIEGYCGAGIQTGLLESLPEFSIPDSLAIIMVHMINPWGCAWDRRENEDNVDIFRNFLYGDPPFAKYPEYDRLAEAICPKEWDGPQMAVADKELRDYEAAHGAGSVIGVARRGQHDYPKGLTYHGRGPTWSKRTIDEIVNRELAEARRIVNFDLHTGYGEYGSGIVVCFEAKGTAIAKALTNWFGENLLFLGDDPIVPAHPRSPYDQVCRKLSARSESFALEFGTDEVAGLFDLLREASWVFNYGDPLSEQARKVRQRYRALFYPEHDDWKRRVWARGRQVFEQTLSAMSGF